MLKVTLLNIISMKEKVITIKKHLLKALNDKLQSTEFIAIKIEEL